MRAELDFHFKEALKREGKLVCPKLIAAANCIFPKPVDWYHEDVQYWSEFGFSYLYLVTEKGWKMIATSIPIFLILHENNN